MGETIDIIRNYRVKKVIFNDGSLVKLEQELIDFLNEFNITYSIAKRGDIISTPYIDLLCLNPNKDKNENDNSLVLYTKILNNKVLLTGDISFSIEKDIINEYPKLKVDILKVGHHCSSTSTSSMFINTIKPKYAIIQVGINNRFNHPSKSVINRLIENGAKILQTSINGSIKMIIRRNEVSIKTAFT